MLFRFTKKNPDRCPYWETCDCNPRVRRLAGRGQWWGQVHVHMSPDPIMSRGDGTGIARGGEGRGGETID